jgi:hypothetical protein
LRLRLESLPVGRHEREAGAPSRHHAASVAQDRASYVDLPLDGRREFLQALAAAGEFVIIECEARRDGQDFYIGLVVAVANDAVAVHHLNTTAVWDPEPSIVPFDEITRVQFSERYTKVYAQYGGQPPGS